MVEYRRIDEGGKLNNKGKRGQKERRDCKSYISL
jgi:hypothetical protein